MNKNITSKKSVIRNIVLSALVIIFITSVILTFYAMLYSETRERIIQKGELSSVSSADEIDKYIKTGITTIKLASYTLDNMLRSGKSQEEIHSFFIDQSSAILNITEENSTGLYGYINGEYVDGTLWDPGENYVPTERPWYIGAMANVGRVAVVDPYLDAQTGNMMITVSKTLCDAKSVVAMDYSIDFLQAVAEDVVKNGEADAEIILDQNYRVIAHSERTEVGNKYLQEGNTFGGAIAKELRKTKGEEHLSLKYNGQEYIIYRALVSNDWICLSVYNTTSVFSQIKTALAFTVVVLITVISILLIVMIRSIRNSEQFTRLSIHMVEALAAAIDAKDEYTNGHSGRVAEYAREIGRRYGYSEEQLNDIYLMGLLHDVGKIGIPDAVINKPGKLTEEEYDIIKTHPSIGAKILSKTKEMPRMAIGARWHHERYDGKGYPDGIEGYRIPNEARIIAVADAYDAMTSRRSYRDVLSQDVVRSEIERGKVTQFDPVLADIIIKMIDEDKDYNMRAKD